MKILEVRDGFIKLETRETITTGTFIEAKSMNKSYIAQVVRTVPTGNCNVVIAKMIFVYDGVFKEYDNTTPYRDAEVSIFSAEEINNLFETPTSINFTSPYGENTSLKIDAGVFNKKLLISVDNVDAIKNLIAGLCTEFSENTNTVIIDTLGYSAEHKYTAGEDFKLPLNTAALAFLYEECLNDATSDSKNLIKEIFQDLSDYSKTVPFLPFATLKTIVDDMVEKQHIFKLLVLKNKLAKFEKLGYFAANIQEANNLQNILKSNTVTIDLSKLDSVFQNRYLEAIYSTFDKLEAKPNVLLLASNNLTKKSFKTVLTNNNSATTLFVNSKFKFLKDIKPLFNTYLIEPGFINNEVFKTYAQTLSALPKDAYLLVGSATKNIALTVEIKEQTFEAELETELEAQENNEIEALLNDIPKDEHTEAIEKKSEDLIEKISEEVVTSPSEVLENLFGDDSEEDEIEEKVEEEYITDDDLMYKEEVVEYTTQVHPEIDIDEESDSEEDEIINLTEADDQEKEDETVSSDNEDIIEVEMDAEIVELDEDETLIETNEASIIEEYEAPTEEPTQIFDNEPEAIKEEKEEENLDIIEQTELSEDILSELPEDTLPDQTFDNNEADETEIIEDLPQELETSNLEAIDAEDELGEIIELNEADLEDADDIIMIDVEDDIMQEIDEETDKEIVEDVDKVFTSIREEDAISDSDLDFIDELNDEASNENIIQDYSPEGSLEELETGFDNELNDDEEGFIEPLEEFNSKNKNNDDNNEILETRNTSTPMVPVYDADIPQEDIVVSDPLEQGDSVIHAKYGNGIVEKMISYGTKTLYSINFENVGRRLLDPSITEIKKA